MFRGRWLPAISQQVTSNELLVVTKLYLVKLLFDLRYIEEFLNLLAVSDPVFATFQIYEDEIPV